MTSQPERDNLHTVNAPAERDAQIDSDIVVADTDDTSDIDAAHLAIDAALSKKALEPVLLDVSGMCSYASFILVVSGRSDRQVDAIADGIVTQLREHDLRPLGAEGRGTGQWVLIDFGDMVVHVFHHPVREHYDIESLWINAKRVPIDIPEEARPTLEDSYTI